MKNFIYTLLIFCLCGSVSAQEITFIIFDEDGPVRGADVVLVNSGEWKTSDLNGSLTFTEFVSDTSQFTLTYGYTSQDTILSSPYPTKVTWRLRRGISADPVIIRALETEEDAAVTYSKVDENYLKDQNTSRDLPFVINDLPSITTTSDAGAGIGYTSMRIRGTDQTRINVTINGVPLNDSESQQVFWVDLPDLASSVDKLQVQRGVGYSSYGGSSFGAAVAINTLQPEREAGIMGEVGYGSFDSRKYSLGLSSGLINNSIYFSGRGSIIKSDGYIDRATSDLKSYYLEGGIIKSKWSVRAMSFGGHERTYQAWNGVPYQYVDIDSLRTFNSAGTEKKGEPYEDEVDDYAQNHYQAVFQWNINPHLGFSFTGHYTRGRGYFELYQGGIDPEEYGLTEGASLVERRWLDNDFYGALFTFEYTPTSVSTWYWGGGIHRYQGGHFGRIIQLDNEILNEKIEYYTNDATKDDIHTYLRYNFNYQGWQGYADVQFRYIDYILRDLETVSGTIEESHFFVMPKLGLSYSFSPEWNTYLSFGVAAREPSRDDFQENINNPPDAEYLYNTELGAVYNQQNYRAGITLYHMYYKDQLILTGELNDVGEYARTNVDRSYRLGMEVYSKWNFAENWEFLANLTLSRNNILDFIEYVDNWNTGEQVAIDRGTTRMIFSPTVISNAKVTYRHFWNQDFYTTIGFDGGYVSRQYLDNSGEEAASLPGYEVFDLELKTGFTISNRWRSELFFFVHNIFDKKYSSNGWTYRFISDFRPEDPYLREGEESNMYHLQGWYPQAGIHFFGGVRIYFR